jgi:CIC family chloride channel protein
MGRAAEVRARWLRSSGPLDLRLLGRTLLHSALVGFAAGVVGAAFFAALEIGQRLLLEGLGGYAPARARGERFLPELAGAGPRLWVLALLPAAGGLVSGLLSSRFAQEASGGGGDTTIHAYHRHGGLIRARVVPVKAAASVAVLATGGSGGREGPTMLIGAAIGSIVGRLLPSSARERRILVVAGIAAGIAAVFRTPLGAALLSVEMLYRDDFESDALVPAILASVVSYSVAVSIFGSATLFGWLPRLEFVPAHLPLYILLAVLVAAASAVFARAIAGVARTAATLPGPVWARPAIGGLAVGALGTAIIVLSERSGGVEAAGLGVFGGGYGTLQAALTGVPGLPAGWTVVALFVGLAAAKLAASALTIGSGCSAGDFAPSLVIGGLLGAAFGHAAALLLGDDSIRPLAFALVGMGTFYGGIAHVPLSALVLVSELAGSYELLVPMMLATGVAFLALRRRTLYPAQPASKRESPLHVEALRPGAALAATNVGEVLIAPEVAAVPAHATLPDVAQRIADARRQLVLPVLDGDGRPEGLAELDQIRVAASDPDVAWAVVADVALPWACVTATMTLSTVGRLLGELGVRQLPVVEGTRLVGYVGEAEIARAALRT